MRRSLILAWTILRGNGLATIGSDARRKNRRFGHFGNFALFVLLFAYMGGIISFSTGGLYRMLEPLSLQSMIVPLFLGAAVTVTFFFGALYSISVFYYSSDVEKLLPLPFRPEHIISAKLLVTAAYIELFVLALALPGMVVYGVMSDAVWYFYPLALLVLLILPLVPLCLASILVMLLMRLTPLARNKDRFNTISGILVMAVTLAIVFFTQSLSRDSGMDIASMIKQGTDGLASVTGWIFPGTSQAAVLLQKAGTSFAVFELLMLLLFSAAAWFLVMLAGRFLYFSGVIGLTSSAGKRRKMDTGALIKASRPGKVWFSYMMKDLRILVRTPVFFMNNVLMNFLWPVIVCIPIFTSSASPASVLAEVRRQAAMLSADSDQMLMNVLCVTFGMAAFISGSNGVSASALSREGKLLYLMKMIPMSYRRQLIAKVSAGVLLGLAGTLTTVILAVAIALPPPWLILAVLPVLPGAAALPALAGIVFDLMWPKLHWDNEQKAVKQNLNVLLGMAVTIILIAVVVVPIFLLSPKWPITLLMLLIIPWILTVALYGLVKFMSTRRMESIQA
jgi:ABC-2 type transport system permease protein